MTTAKESNRIINGKINSISKSLVNIKAVLTDTAFLIIDHAIKHGDIDSAGKLLTQCKAGEINQAYITNLVLFFRASGVSISVSGGKYSASKSDKSKGFIRLENVNPLKFETSELLEKKERQKETREANKAKRELAESQKAEELAKQLDKANQATSLEVENKSLKAENKALKARIKALESELASYQAIAA